MGAPGNQKLCEFCAIQIEPQSAYDEQVQLAGYTNIKPALGMLIAGNILAITNEHHTSFAQLGRAGLEEVNEALESALAHLGKFFGPYFRTEHGSDNLLDRGSGGCIVHATSNFFPT